MPCGLAVLVLSMYVWILSLCMSVCLPVCLSVCLSVCSSVRLFCCLFLSFLSLFSSLQSFFFRGEGSGGGGGSAPHPPRGLDGRERTVCSRLGTIKSDVDECGWNFNPQASRIFLSPSGPSKTSEHTPYSLNKLLEVFSNSVFYANMLIVVKIFRFFEKLVFSFFGLSCGLISTNLF